MNLPYPSPHRQSHLATLITLCLAMTLAAGAAVNGDAPGAGRPPPVGKVVEIDHEKPDEAITDALGRELHHFYVTAPRGYMLNVELRFYDSEGKLDPMRSTGTWYLSSDGFDRHQIFIWMIDPDKLLPDRHSLALTIVSSEGDAIRVHTYKSAGRAELAYTTPSPAGTDQRLLQALWNPWKWKPAAAPDQDAQPQALDARPQLADYHARLAQWLDDPQELEKVERIQMALVLRVERVPDDLPAELRPLVTLPKSKITFPYAPGTSERFYPWSRLQEEEITEPQENPAPVRDAVESE